MDRIIQLKDPTSGDRQFPITSPQAVRDEHGNTWQDMLDAKQDVISDLATIRSDAAFREVYYCTYGTTTAAEITAAVAAGKLPVCLYASYCLVYGRTTETSHVLICPYGNIIYFVTCNLSTNAWAIQTIILQTSIGASNKLAEAYIAGNANVVDSTTRAVTVAMDPRKTYKYLNASGVTSLAFTLNTPAEPNADNIYRLKFYSGATATAVTFPSGLKYPDGTQPSIEANTYYEITVDEDGWLTCQGFKTV